MSDRPTIDRSAEPRRTFTRAGDELRLASRAVGASQREVSLSVPTIRCGGCIGTIEGALGRLPGVERARVNLSTKRVSVRWRAGCEPPPLQETLAAIGHEAHLDEGVATTRDGGWNELVRSLAVAGFAASNIMMLSVAVWSGAEPPTRDLFHWMSALIALPALAYSGRVFFRSAWHSIRRGRTNMDVPISIGVLIAFGLSLYETIHHGPHAYFDAAISLLFFLLIGRTLDHHMRDRARVAVEGLGRLAGRGALVLRDEVPVYLPIGEIVPGMIILLPAGERVPVDSRVVVGRSDLDRSIVSGESVPQPAGPGSTLEAGTLNLTGPLTIVATAAARESFLAELLRMMEAAESGRSKYRRIADRASGLYAPVVHLAALLTFLGWIVVSGDVHLSLTIAVAVLIVTCPCALGLAVPMVQVVAARNMFEKGIMIKDGGALERLADIDIVVFDKTGTLTAGEPRLLDADAIDEASLTVAAALASHSRHPYSLAIARAGRMRGLAPVRPTSVSERPGAGLAAVVDTHAYCLGRPTWALADGPAPLPESSEAGVVLSKDGRLVAAFRFEHRLRPDAREAVAALAAAGIAVEILSGDRAAMVKPLAAALDVPFLADTSPAGKVDRIAALASAGGKVLMVGDGLNDAPALVAAHVSMAPASAAEVGRNAADVVYLRDSLLAVPQVVAIARSAKRLVRQNLALAVAYNGIAVPIAILGYLTPLIAAIAMSLSSVVVVCNALRLGGRPRSVETPRDLRRSAPASAQLATEDGLA